MCRIKRFLRKIYKVLLFIPVIWKDEDWDSSYMLELLVAKLVCMKQYFMHSHIVVPEEEKEILDGINNTLNAIDKFLKSDCYGETDVVPPFEVMHKDVPSPDNNGCTRFITLRKDTGKELTEKEEEQYKKYLTDIVTREQEYWESIWDIIKAEGRKWWD